MEHDKKIRLKKSTYLKIKKPKKIKKEIIVSPIPVVDSLNFVPKLTNKFYKPNGELIYDINLLSKPLFKDYTFRCPHPDCLYVANRPDHNNSHHLLKHNTSIAKCTDCYKSYDHDRTIIKNLLKYIENSTDDMTTKSTHIHNCIAKMLLVIPLCSELFDEHIF